MKKNIINATLALATIFALASCAKTANVDNGTQPVNPVEVSEAPVFTGTIIAYGDNGVKTTLTAEDYVWWEDTDVIAINSSSSLYSVTPSSPATDATFTIKAEQETPTAPFSAYYPASLLVGTTPTLPAIQTYAEGKITNNPMYAYNESSESPLEFHNICALIELTLKGTASVRKIEISNPTYALNGSFEIVSNAAHVTASATDATKKVTLDCGELGKALSAGGEKFYVAIPAGTYTLTFTIYDTAGQTYVKTTNVRAAAMSANKIYAITMTHYRLTCNFPCETIQRFCLV